MYTVFVNGRRWDGYKSLQAAKRMRSTLKENELFKSAEITIYGPKGGKH